MTTTETAATSDPWTKQLEQLRARYKHLRPAVLAALNVLLHNENATDDDAKAQAAAHGVRITAASLNAARTVLSRMHEAPAPTSTPKAPAAQGNAPSRPARRSRENDEPLDLEKLVRGVVTRIQGHGNAEADRIRDAVRKAITTLQAALA